MIQDLEYLLQLQEIDLRIREQELAKEQYPAAVADLEQQIVRAKNSLDNAIKKLAQVQTDKQGIEEQTLRAHEGLEKSQERLNSIKTNREYDAVHAEIETQKNVINTAESRTKSLTDEIERLSKAVEDNKAELERVRTENEPQIADLKSKIGSIDSIIAEITKERDEVTPKITKPSLRTYDLIRKKRKTGRAISVISDARNCTVCFKVLEPQLYNEIKRGTRITLCQSCGSIMVWLPGQG